MEQKTPLQSISDDELLRRLAELTQQSRRVESDLVAHIAEVDERRLYAREASPSMFAYCTEVLHLSEAEAYLRITAARASRRHPLLLSMLADGRLHVSGIGRLAPHLTGQNAEELLTRAVHKSKRQIEELIAELWPLPDVPAAMRKLPRRRSRYGLGLVSHGGERGRPSSVELGSIRERYPDGAVMPDAETGLERARILPRRPDEVVTPDRDMGVARAALNRDQARSEESPSSVPERGLDAAATQLLRPGGVDGSPTSCATSPVPPATVLPLSPSRYKVQFTASAAFRDKLERLRALMRTRVPDGDLAAILEEAVTEKLQRLEARRFATTQTPKKALTQTDTSAKSRRIPAAVRRAVTQRDGHRCRYVDEQGRRCTERDRLEFHHRHPYGLGGDHDPRNIWLACRSHNQYFAVHDYGRRALDRYRQSDHPCSDLSLT
jgi:hypothetical protein